MSDPRVRSGSRPACQVIDLSQATVLPGLDRHAHAHVQQPRPAGMTTERSTLIAINNLQADLHAGFTAARDMSSHGNGFGDVDIRNAINMGDLDGPRFQVSGRGIRWAPKPAEGPRESARLPDDSLGRGRARRRPRAGGQGRGLDQAVSRPVRYSFSPTGEAQYVLMYPLPVLQAIVDEAHRLEPQDGVPRVRRRRSPDRDHRRLRHRRARLRPDPGAAHRDVEEGLYYDPTLDPVHRAVHGRQRREEHRRQVPDDSDLRERGVDGGQDTRV